MKRTLTLIFKIIYAFFAALTPLIISLGIGIIIISDVPGQLGIITASIIGLLGIWGAYLVFKTVMDIGVLEFVTAPLSSPRLDNLKATPMSDFKLRLPEELEKLHAEGKHLCSGGSLRLFGDWFGEPDYWVFMIEKVAFDKAEKTLVFHFKNGNTLQVEKPRLIFEAKTYLKIMGAASVKWKWTESDKRSKKKFSSFIAYLHSDRKITTSTNSKGYKPRFCVSLSAPAVMIYGTFHGDRRK